MKILVTGATGHIGRQLVAQLAPHHEVYGLTRMLPQDASGPAAYLPVDLWDERQVSEAMAAVRPEMLIHLAWQEHVPDYLASPAHWRWEEASCHLFAAFCQHGGQRAVLTGSAYEQTMAETAYSVAKASLCRRVLKQAEASGVPAAWCRLFGSYGPYDRPHKFIPSVIASLIHGTEFQVRTPDVLWDYLHVSDVARALAAVMAADFAGVIDIASGNSIALGHLCAAIRELYYNSGQERSDLPLLLQPTVPAVGRELTERIGWQPLLDLRSGLRQTIDWYRRRAAGNQA